MWKTAEPVVGAWIARHVGPVGRIEEAVEGAGEIGRFLGQVPGLLTRAERIAQDLSSSASGGFRLDEETIEAIGAHEAKRNRSGNLALWAIAILLAILVLG